MSDPDKASAYIDDLRKTLGGALNAGKMPVLVGGSSVVTVGMSAVDAEIIATWKFTIEEIALQGLAGADLPSSAYQ